MTTKDYLIKRLEAYAMAHDLGFGSINYEDKIYRNEQNDTFVYISEDYDFKPIELTIEDLVDILNSERFVDNKEEIIENYLKWDYVNLPFAKI